MLERDSEHGFGQLVKVGSMVEKDCLGLLAEIRRAKPKEKGNKRTAERSNTKSLAGLSIAQPHADTSLLLVPVTIKGTEVKAVLDTGSTYTLMQENLWKQLGVTLHWADLPPPSDSSWPMGKLTRLPTRCQYGTSGMEKSIG